MASEAVGSGSIPLGTTKGKKLKLSELLQKTPSGLVDVGQVKMRQNAPK